MSLSELASAFLQEKRPGFMEGMAARKKADIDNAQGLSALALNNANTQGKLLENEQQQRYANDPMSNPAVIKARVDLETSIQTPTQHQMLNDQVVKMGQPPLTPWAELQAVRKSTVRTVPASGGYGIDDQGNVVAEYAPMFDPNKPAGGERPSNVKEWEYFNTLIDTQKEQYLRMKRADKFLGTPEGYVTPNPNDPNSATRVMTDGVQAPIPSQSNMMSEMAQARLLYDATYPSVPGIPPTDAPPFNDFLKTEWPKAKASLSGQPNAGQTSTAGQPVQAPPNPKDRLSGHPYITPKGVLIWTGTGWLQQ